MAEGRCNCSSIKVSIPAMPKVSVICYCSNCRRAGGSIGSIILPLEKDTVAISNPNNHLKSYKDSDTKSGNTITRQFCGNCGCPIMSLISDDSPKVFLKGGLFEEIPPAEYSAFDHEEPTWLKVVKPSEANV